MAPGQDTVLAVTAQKSDVNRVIGLLWEHVLGETSQAALPPCPESRALADRLKALRFPVPALTGLTPDIPIDGIYRLCANPAGLERMTLRIVREELEVRLQYAKRDDSLLHFRFDRPAEGTDIFIKDIETHRQPYAGFASWAGNALALTVYYIETPYVTTHRVQFDGGGIRLDFSVNVSFTLTDFSCRGERLPDC